MGYICFYCSGTCDARHLLSSEHVRDEHPHFDVDDCLSDCIAAVSVMVWSDGGLRHRHLQPKIKPKVYSAAKCRQPEKVHKAVQRVKTPGKRCNSVRLRPETQRNTESAYTGRRDA